MQSSKELGSTVSSFQRLSWGKKVSQDKKQISGHTDKDLWSCIGGHSRK
jgi:hypothetical protein